MLGLLLITTVMAYFFYVGKQKGKQSSKQPAKEVCVSLHCYACSMYDIVLNRSQRHLQHHCSPLAERGHTVKGNGMVG